MTNKYEPDGWVLMRITNPEANDGVPFYKIGASWSGGYLDGDSWRVNSGITKVIEKDDLYEVHGYSGSVYILHKDRRDRLNVPAMSVVQKMKKGLDTLVGGSLELIETGMPEELIEKPKKASSNKTSTKKEQKQALEELAKLGQQLEKESSDGDK